MRSLDLYRFSSRFRGLSYRAKILATAILGTTIPPLTLVGLSVLRAAPEQGRVSIGVVLAATLIGAGVTIWALNALLRPIVMTSSALRAYRTKRELPVLPTGFTDEAGTLMADAAGTVGDLDAALAALGGSDDNGVGHIYSISHAARNATETRVVTERDLRRAIAADEFRLHLQPVIDLNLGRAVGAEALIRWQHPGRGLLLPQEFIPLAEASGLIDAIGHWVVRTACAQLNSWSAARDDLLGLAINLSARQFLDPKLPGVIVEALADAGVSPDRFEIELTETVAMRDRDVTARIFGQLRDRGVRVAIDDFGAGYSNMSYLRALPFDKLKIDRKLVAGVDRASNLHAIASALIALARGLGAKVVAEGAEREEEVRLLYEDGCHLFQGFHFGRPVAPERFHESISDIALGAKMMSIAGRSGSSPGFGRAVA